MRRSGFDVIWDRYDHQERLTAEEAMQHVYFNPIRSLVPLREATVPLSGAPAGP